MGIVQSVSHISTENRYHIILTDPLAARGTCSNNICDGKPNKVIDSPSIELNLGSMSENSENFPILTSQLVYRPCNVVEINQLGMGMWLNQY